MMWVVYNIESSKIYQKFYSKKSAKEYIKYSLDYPLFKKNVGLAKVDLMKYDKWKMWIKLGGKGRV